MRKILGTFALVVESFVNVLFVDSCSTYESFSFVNIQHICVFLNIHVCHAGVPCSIHLSPSNRVKSIPSTMATKIQNQQMFYFFVCLTDR